MRQKSFSRWLLRSTANVGQNASQQMLHAFPFPDAILLRGKLWRARRPRPPLATGGHQPRQAFVMREGDVNPTIAAGLAESEAIDAEICPAGVRAC